MSKLTLEQVRDRMRAWRSSTGSQSMRLLRWADAIDAAIAARGEPVATVIKKKVSAGVFQLCAVLEKDLPVGTRLCTAPPAAEVEAAPSMSPREHLVRDIRVALGDRDNNNIPVVSLVRNMRADLAEAQEWIDRLRKRNAVLNNAVLQARTTPTKEKEK